MYNLFQYEHHQRQQEIQSRLRNLYPSFNDETNTMKRDYLASLHNQRVQRWMSGVQQDPESLQCQAEILRGRRKGLREILNSMPWRQRNPMKELGPSRITSTRYQTEKERIALTLDEHRKLYIREPYEPPSKMKFRERDPNKELDGSFRYRTRNFLNPTPPPVADNEIKESSRDANTPNNGEYRTFSESIAQNRLRVDVPSLWMGENFRVRAVPKGVDIGSSTARPPASGSDPFVPKGSFTFRERDPNKDICPPFRGISKRGCVLPALGDPSADGKGSQTHQLDKSYWKTTSEWSCRGEDPMMSDDIPDGFTKSREVVNQARILVQQCRNG